MLQKRRNKGNYCRGKKETSHSEQGRVKCNGERLRKDRESGEKEREGEDEVYFMVENIFHLKRTGR